jgi:hypothetical protein
MAAGFGDTISFGASAWIRESWDLSSGVVDACSGYYTLGQVAGVAADVLLAKGAVRAVAGPMKQWVRIGKSYSTELGLHTRLSIRIGASPAGNYKYLAQIPSPIMQSLNQSLRTVRFPGWRGLDAGHYHIWF